MQSRLRLWRKFKDSGPRQMQEMSDDVPSPSGRPRKRCRWLLADKGYDAEALRRYCDRYRMQPAIPT